MIGSQPLWRRRRHFEHPAKIPDQEPGLSVSRHMNFRSTDTTAPKILRAPASDEFRDYADDYESCQFKIDRKETIEPLLETSIPMVLLNFVVTVTYFV